MKKIQYRLPGSSRRHLFRRGFWPMLAALPFLAACGQQPAISGETATGTTVPVSVEIVSSTSGTYLEAIPGQVRPTHSAVVSARIQGEIARIPVTPGQQVARGDLVVELLAEDLKARVRRGEAELEAASHELARVESLIESRAATPRELEAAEARHRSAQASLEEAQTFFEYTMVRAPFDGVVARKHVEVGDLVSPGEPIVDLYSPNAYRLEMWVPESLARSIVSGDEIAFEIDPAVASGTGVVNEIRPGVDPATRTVLAKVDLPPSDDLRNGQYGRAFVAGSESRALMVSETSLLRRGQLEYLFVVSGDPAIARLRLVRTGRLRDGKIEILSGLDEGEAVVAEAPSQLRDGQHVEIH